MNMKLILNFIHNGLKKVETVDDFMQKSKIQWSHVDLNLIPGIIIKIYLLAKIFV